MASDQIGSAQGQIWPQIKLAQPKDRFGLGSDWLSLRTDFASDQTSTARGQMWPQIKLVQPEDRFGLGSDWLNPLQIWPQTKLAQPPILSFLTTAGTLHRPQSVVRKKTLVILIPTLHVYLLSETFPQTLP